MVHSIDTYIKDKKALIVEDETAIAQLLRINLSQMGFVAEICHDAQSALSKLQHESFI